MTTAATGPNNTFNSLLMASKFVSVLSIGQMTRVMHCDGSRGKNF